MSVGELGSLAAVYKPFSSMQLLMRKSSYKDEEDKFSLE